MHTFNFTISTDNQQFADWLKGCDQAKISNIMIDAMKGDSHYPRRKYDAGTEGEQSVIDILSPVYELDFKSSHAGDIIAKRSGKSVLVEVKNYSTTVPYKEVEKFHRDLDANINMSGGLFISLKSSITKIGKSISFMKRNHQYIIYLVSPDRDILLSMVGLLFDVNEHRVVNIDKLAREIDNLEELRANLVQTHTSMADLKSTFNRSMDAIIRQTQMFELKFGESIRRLTGSVATNEVISELEGDIVSFIISKFPDSALSRNETHRDYVGKFIKHFNLDGNFNIKNKIISWISASINILKTKTTLVFEHNFQIDVLKYDIKIDGDLMKVEIKPKNYTLLETLFGNTSFQ